MRTVYPYNVQRLGGPICDSTKDVKAKLKEAEGQYLSAVQLTGKYPGLPVGFSSELSILSGRLSTQQQQIDQREREDWVTGCGYGAEMRAARDLLEDIADWKSRVQAYASSPAYQRDSGSTSPVAVTNPFVATADTFPAWVLPTVVGVAVLGAVFLIVRNRK